MASPKSIQSPIFPTFESLLRGCNLHTEPQLGKMTNKQIDETNFYQTSHYKYFYCFKPSSQESSNRTSIGAKLKHAKISAQIVSLAPCRGCVHFGQRQRLLEIAWYILHPRASRLDYDTRQGEPFPLSVMGKR